MKILLVGVILVLSGAIASAQEPGVPQRVVTIHPPPGMRIKAGDTVTAAKLVHREQPVYPPLARQTRISGTVRLHAIIGTDGKVQQLDLISGHPLLVQSALDAVRKWEYQPTLLNGEPVEVDTTIDVIFAFNQKADENGPQPTGVKPTAPAEIDPALRADILALLDQSEATKSAKVAMRKMFDGMRPTMLKNFAGLENREKILDSYENKLIGLSDTEDFREIVVTTYAKYFNDDDVKNLIAFYRTPTGKKLNESMSQLTADLVGNGQRLAREKLPAIFKELCTEYPELGGKLPECPAPDQNKKSELFMPEADVRPFAK